MRYYCYNELTTDKEPLVCVLSEKEILDRYWSYWSSKMRERGKPEDQITKENCIDEWVVVNWAWESKENI